MTEQSELPRELEAELARLGVMCPRPEPPPARPLPAAWKPAYPGDEPPF